MSKKSKSVAVDFLSPVTIYEKHCISRSNASLSVPFNVRRFFPDYASPISFSGTQISLGGDYGELSEIREAIAWYVQQLNGSVKWKKDDV